VQLPQICAKLSWQIVQQRGLQIGAGLFSLTLNVLLNLGHNAWSLAAFCVTENQSKRILARRPLRLAAAEDRAAIPIKGSANSLDLTSPKYKTKHMSSISTDSDNSRVSSRFCCVADSRSALRGLPSDPRHSIAVAMMASPDLDNQPSGMAPGAGHGLCELPRSAVSNSPDQQLSLEVPFCGSGGMTVRHDLFVLTGASPGGSPAPGSPNLLDKSSSVPFSISTSLLQLPETQTTCMKVS
jgi:hypothetical protein